MLLFLFLSEKLINIFKNVVRILRFKCLLQQIHLVAYIVAHLYLLVLHLELLSASVLKDSLALLVRTFDLLAPFFMFLDCRKVHKFVTVMTNYLNYLDEFVENVRTGPHS